VAPSHAYRAVARHARRRVHVHVTRCVSGALRTLRAEGVDSPLWRLVLAQAKGGTDADGEEAAALRGCDRHDVFAELVTALANELRVLVDIYGADVELCVDGADDPEYKKESKRRAK
jgi:hypothetical protein